MPRASRHGSTTANRLKRSRQSHDFVLDAGEHAILKSVERVEWTTVAGFGVAKAWRVRSASAPFRRLRQAHAQRAQ